MTPTRTSAVVASTSSPAKAPCGMLPTTPEDQPLVTSASTDGPTSAAMLARATAGVSPLGFSSTADGGPSSGHSNFSNNNNNNNSATSSAAIVTLRIYANNGNNSEVPSIDVGTPGLVATSISTAGARTPGAASASATAPNSHISSITLGAGYAGTGSGGGAADGASISGLSMATTVNAGGAVDTPSAMKGAHASPSPATKGSQKKQKQQQQQQPECDCEVEEVTLEGDVPYRLLCGTSSGSVVMWSLHGHQLQLEALLMQQGVSSTSPVARSSSIGGGNPTAAGGASGSGIGLSSTGAVRGLFPLHDLGMLIAACGNGWLEVMPLPTQRHMHGGAGAAGRSSLNRDTSYDGAPSSSSSSSSAGSDVTMCLLPRASVKAHKGQLLSGEHGVWSCGCMLVKDIMACRHVISCAPKATHAVIPRCYSSRCGTYIHARLQRTAWACAW